MESLRGYWPCLVSFFDFPAEHWKHQQPDRISFRHGALVRARDQPDLLTFCLQNVWSSVNRTRIQLEGWSNCKDNQIVHIRLRRRKYHARALHERTSGRLPRLTAAVFTLIVFLGVTTRAQSEPASARSPCPTKLVVLLNKGRSQVQGGNLLTAKQDYYEPLLQADGLQQCTLDFRLKAVREYGDLLAKMAKGKTGDKQTEYKGSLLLLGTPLNPLARACLSDQCHRA